MWGLPREENEIQWKRANQEWLDSYQFFFLFLIPYMSEEKYGRNNELVCQKWNSQQSLVDQNNWTISRADPEYSGQKKLT